jgi:hypothetical protein
MLSPTPQVRLTLRSSNQPNLSWSSISRQPKPSTSYEITPTLIVRAVEVVIE